MSQAQNAPRLDVYGPIHKALRRNLCGLLVRFSSGDFSDDTQRQQLLNDLRMALKLAASHLKTEDALFHPTLEERAPGAAAEFTQDHDGHTRSTEELTQLAHQLEAAPPAERQAVAMKLYHRFGIFVGENLVHMAAEETHLQPLFHKHFTDQELGGLMGKMRAMVPQDVFMANMGFMIPAITRGERVALFGEIRASAPPQAFNALLQVAARPNLAPEDWQDLTQRLGLPS